MNARTARFGNRRRRAGLFNTLALYAVSAAVSSFAGGPAGLAAPDSLPPVPPNGELGFVFSSFAPAIHQGPDDCPEGLARTTIENYLLTQPATECDRLSRPENEKELQSRWQQTLVTPDGRNMCTAPEYFKDRAPQRMVQGKVSYGLNLDGSDGSTVASGTCAHQKFISPTGEKGIDNQLFRAQGCANYYRGIDGVSGDLVKQYQLDLANGEKSVVLLIRGIHSLENDANVEVILASTKDQPILDSNQKFVPGGSFTITSNPRWRTVFKARIDHGVLTTDVKDVHLNQAWGYGGPEGHHAEWDFRRARLRLEFQPDGTVSGLFGAYQPLLNVMNLMRFGGIGVASVGHVDCAAMYSALVKSADGDPDPKTHQCTTVSLANTVVGVPAHVFDRPPPRASLTANPAYHPDDRFQGTPARGSLLDPPTANDRSAGKSASK